MENDAATEEAQLLDWVKIYGDENMELHRLHVGLFYCDVVVWNLEGGPSFDGRIGAEAPHGLRASYDTRTIYLLEGLPSMEEAKRQIEHRLRNMAAGVILHFQILDGLRIRESNGGNGDIIEEMEQV